MGSIPVLNIVVEEVIVVEEETGDDSKPTMVYQFMWQNDDDDEGKFKITTLSCTLFYTLFYNMNSIKLFGVMFMVDSY